MRLQTSGPYCWKAGSVHFCMGKENLAFRFQASGSKSSSHCSGSSQQAARGGRERWRETEILEDDSFTPLTVGLLCTRSPRRRSKAHTEHGSIKHSSQQGGTRCAVSVDAFKCTGTLEHTLQTPQCRIWVLRNTTGPNLTSLIPVRSGGRNAGLILRNHYGCCRHMCTTCCMLRRNKIRN